MKQYGISLAVVVTVLAAVLSGWNAFSAFHAGSMVNGVLSAIAAVLLLVATLYNWGAARRNR